MQVGSNIYIIAGELSGDAIGAKLMTELRKRIPNIKFHGLGGGAMNAQGMQSLFNYDQINLMGFIEILPHIFHLSKIIKQTADDILAKKPSVLITIDSPGFCFRVAKLAKQLCPNIKMIHIVAPSVWVYKPGRAAKFASIYHHMLTLLPFEPPYFEKVGLPATCIGHPVFDQKFGGGEDFRHKYGIANDTKLVVMTPGSRKGEVARHLPIFLNALKEVRRHHEDLVIVIPLALSQRPAELQESNLPEKIIVIDYNERLAAYAAANVALAKSGTNTLEIAASNTPMIVAYKLNFLTYLAIKLMAKIKYASLINIVAGKEVVPEFLQHKANAKNLACGLLKILDNPTIAEKQVTESMKSLSKMGLDNSSKPAEIAAEVIIKCL